ncbi:MAG: 3-ketoacyl-ACP reductase [Verrucomicrobiota bacterium]|nr:3-ketoacyl-ACP reductase [Verrucomicrobiota bacterium]
MRQAALITGASRGIGRGIAIELARAGFNLIINFQANAAAAEETIRMANEVDSACVALPFRADISNRAERMALLQFTREKFNRLDILVNNAGVAPQIRTDLLESSEESFDRLININVKAPYFLTQEAAKWMIRQAQEEPGTRKPKIVTISSVSAYTASINRGDYCISKAALSMLTPLFATRLAELGIQVFEVRPGIVATDMTAGVQDKYDRLIKEGLTPLARWGTPKDVGQAVAAIAEERFPFSTGEVINVDGGFHLRRL